MTDFQVGDIVRVEFLGVIGVEKGVDGRFRVDTDNSDFGWVSSEHITFVRKPLPTKPGSVIWWPINGVVRSLHKDGLWWDAAESDSNPFPHVMIDKWEASGNAWEILHDAGQV